MNVMLGYKSREKLEDVILKAFSSTYNAADVHQYNYFAKTVKEITHSCARNIFLPGNADIPLQNLYVPKANSIKIKQIVQTLSNKKTPVFNGIRIQDIKLLADKISDVICYLIHSSLET